MDLQSLKIERRPATSRRRGNPWPLRTALLAGLAGMGWLFWAPLSAWIDRVRLPEVRAFAVVEATSAAAAATRGTAANGYVVAARRAALSSDVPGRIVELAVREGSIVKKGDVVARLYADEYRAALQRSEADLAAAEAAILRAEAVRAERAADEAQAKNAEAGATARAAAAKADLDWAAAELKRVTDLVATGSGSSRDLDRATTDREATAARWTAAGADLDTTKLATTAAAARTATAIRDVTVTTAQRDAARAARDLAAATLDKTAVKAPFDGVVVLKDAEVGEVVSPNAQGGSNARGAICTLVDFASLEVQANVPESSLGAVQLQAPVDVFLDAAPDERLTGRVDRIWPTADRSKATVEVRIVVEQREQLRPEYGVRVVFRNEAAADGPVDASAAVAKAIVVPDSAVVDVGGKPTVFVIERDVVRAVAVATGERKSGRVAVTAGLRAGQRIVAAPPATLQDQDRVRLADN